MALEQVIVTLLEESGLTRYHIAKICGISNSALSRIMNGQRKPSMSILNKLTAVLDIKISLKENLPIPLERGRPR